MRGSCLQIETEHRLADNGTQKNSTQERALLRGCTHHAQHRASDKKDGSRNIHDEVDEDGIGLKLVGSSEDKLFFL